jgi:hypothetical protein
VSMALAEDEAEYVRLLGQLSTELDASALYNCILAMLAKVEPQDDFDSEDSDSEDDEDNELPEWLLRASPAGSNLCTDACRAVAAAAQLHASDSDLQSAACDFFCAHASAHLAADVVACMYSLIQAALRQHPLDGDLQVAAFEAVTAVVGNYVAAARIFARLGAVADVVAALSGHPHDEMVQESACHALSVLVEDSPERRAEARKAGAVSSVLQLLGRCTFNPGDPREWLYFVVSDLSCDRRMAAALCGAGAVERGVELLRQAQHPRERSALCLMLTLVCCHPGARERAGRAGAVEAVAAILNMHRTPDYKLVARLYPLLEELIKVPENVPRIAAARLHRAELDILLPKPDEDTSGGAAADAAESRDNVLRYARVYAEAAADAAAAALLAEEAEAATGTKKPSGKRKKKGAPAAAAAPANEAAAGGGASADETGSGCAPAVLGAAEPPASAERRQQCLATNVARQVDSMATAEAPASTPSCAAAVSADASTAGVTACATGALAAGGTVAAGNEVQVGVPSVDELFPWLHVDPRWTPPSPPSPVQEEPVPLSQPQPLRQLLQQLPPPPQPPLLPSAFDAAVRAAVDAEVAAAVAAAVKREVAAAVAPLRAELAPLRAALEAADKRLSCVLCLDAPRCTALLPCRHLATCGGAACAALLGAPPRCPLCRERVTDTMLLFA